MKSARPEDSETDLALRFDKDLAKIMEVEEKASISKSTHFFCRRVYVLRLDVIRSHTDNIQIQ